ncbi:hypothetical protein WN943_010056 [Citrus x changshan-huyou]
MNYFLNLLESFSELRIVGEFGDRLPVAPKLEKSICNSSLTASQLRIAGHGLVFIFMPSAGIQGAAASQYLGFLNRTNDGNMNNNVFGIDRKITAEMRPSLVRKITAELVRLHGRAHTRCCPATAADDGRFFGLGEMGEREIVGGEIRERDILVSNVFLWLMLIEVCLAG